MLTMHVLVALARLSHCWLADGDITVHFRSSDGGAVTRRYSRACAMFDESRYLRTRLEEHRHGVSVDGGKSGAAEVELECTQEVFDAAAQLMDAPLDSEIPADVAFCTLDLAETLDLRDGKRKGMLYRGAARATSESDRLADEMKKRRSHSGIGRYILEVLRERARAYGVVMDVEGKKATLSTANDARFRYVSVETIDEIIIVQAAMRRKILCVLEWLADIKGLQALCLFECNIDAGTIEHVAAMKGLRQLSMCRCRIGPGGLGRLQSLASLKELEVSYSSLNEKDVSTISQLKGLTGLSIKHCVSRINVFEFVQKLSSLKTLCLSVPLSSNDDLSGIGEMPNLEKLEIGCCKEQDEEILNCLERLETIKDLTISALPFKIVSKDNSACIGKIRRLVKLDLSSSITEAGALELVPGLEMLRELTVSCNTLSDGDVDRIGNIKDLEVLKIDRCNNALSPENVKHLKRLKRLRRLDMSFNKLDGSELADIGEIVSLRSLDICYCGMDKKYVLDDGDTAALCVTHLVRGLRVYFPLLGVVVLPLDFFFGRNTFNFSEVGSVKHLRELVNLEELDISFNRVSPEDMKALGCMQKLRKLNMQSCTIDAGSFAAFERADNLVELDISGINILDSSDIQAIGTFRSLVVLKMNESVFKAGDARHLRELVNLEELDISFNRVSPEDMKALGCMQKLRKLNMQSCIIDAGSFAAFERADNLVELDISGINTLDSSDIQAIGTFRSLVVLKMNNCVFKPGSLEYIRDIGVLSRLDICNSVLNEKDVLGIGSAKCLMSLSIRHCNICPGSLVHLGNSCLAYLDVSRVALRSTDIAEIGNIKSIRFLLADNCKIEEGSLGGIKDLPLVQLSVYRARLNKSDMACIVGFKHLKSLNIGRCTAEPGILERVKSLSKLEYLNVSGHTLRREDMLAIGSLCRLRTLVISKCAVEPGTLEHIKGLKRLSCVYVYSVKGMNLQDRSVVKELHSQGVSINY